MADLSKSIKSAFTKSISIERLKNAIELKSTSSCSQDEEETLDVEIKPSKLDTKTVDFTNSLKTAFIRTIPIERLQKTSESKPVACNSRQGTKRTSIDDNKGPVFTLKESIKSAFTRSIPIERLESTSDSNPVEINSSNGDISMLEDEHPASESDRDTEYQFHENFIGSPATCDISKCEIDEQEESHADGQENCADAPKTVFLQCNIKEEEEDMEDETSMFCENDLIETCKEEVKNEGGFAAVYLNESGHSSSMAYEEVEDKPVIPSDKDMLQTSTSGGSETIKIPSARPSTSVEPVIPKPGCSSSVVRPVLNGRINQRKTKSVQMTKVEVLCQYCGKGFTKKFLLDMHMTIHMKEELYICEYCGKSFSDRTHLTTHLQNHKKGEPFSCDLCNKSFCYKSSLVVHKMCIHNNNNNKYSCELCGRTFARKSYLTLHNVVHSDGNFFSCKLCKRKFREKKHYDSHMENHFLRKLLLLVESEGDGSGARKNAKNLKKT